MCNNVHIFLSLVIMYKSTVPLEDIYAVYSSYIYVYIP
jgi:hypothetical protein